jgi:outer membrane protein assembly factor BamB
MTGTKQKGYLSLFVVALFGLLALPVFAQDAKQPEARWPQFRGPGGQGIAREGMRLPVEFGPDKNVLWKTPLPHGHSSPCVWDNHIYVTGFDNQTKKLETLCIERKSGKVLWRQAAPAKSFEKVHQLNSLASSTPAADGERVYVYFGSYGLLCYDQDGKELWKRPLPPITSGFGSGTSPVVAGELVLLNSGKGGFVSSSLTLLAFNRRTGETVWEKDRPRGGATGLWSSPVVRSVAGAKLRGTSSGAPAEPRDGADEVLVVGGTSVIAYNLADGSERWRLGGLPPISLNSPAVADGLAYFSLTNPIGEPDNVVKLAPFAEALKQFDKNKDGKIAISEVPEDLMMFGRGRDDKVGDWAPLRSGMKFHDKDRDGALDRDEWQVMADSFAKTAESVQIAAVCVRLEGKGDVTATNVVWKQTRAVPEVPSPLCYQGRVYLVSEKGILTCREAKTGKEIYQRRLGLRGTCYASPVAGDGKVYAASDGGTLVVLKAGDKFELLAKISFDESILATPALVDGKIYLRTDQHLYAFGE